jgi:hypothetical protein
MKDNEWISVDTNPFKIGDSVRLHHSIKDAYGEVWHEKGEIIKIKYIHPDGNGLMFWSDLGVHFKHVDKA